MREKEREHEQAEGRHRGRGESQADWVHSIVPGLGLDHRIMTLGSQP